MPKTSFSHWSPKMCVRNILKKALKAVGLTSANPKSVAPTDHDQIKAIIEPFRQIFMTALENVDHDCVSSFATCLSSDATHYTINLVSRPNSYMTAKGRAAFPPSIPYDLQTAIMKLDQCDLSAFCFLPWIRDALRPIGATVEWVMVHPSRLAYLYINTDPTNNCNVFHSVFCITAADHRQYFADFTQQQFGFCGTDWFTRKDEYMQRHARGFSHIASKKNMADTGEFLWRFKRGYQLSTYIFAVCEEIDWHDYRGLPVDGRIPWIEARAKEIMDRMDVDKLWNEEQMDDDCDDDA
jgi:hypothetical protein